MDRLLHGPAQVKARQEADPVTLMINKRGQQITGDNCNSYITTSHPRAWPSTAVDTADSLMQTELSSTGWEIKTSTDRDTNFNQTQFIMNSRTYSTKVQLWAPQSRLRSGWNTKIVVGFWIEDWGGVSGCRMAEEWVSSETWPTIKLVIWM